MTKACVPYFDHAEVEVDDLATIGDVEAVDGMGAVTLKAFLDRTTADRTVDTHHVYAYYRDFRAAVGGENGLDLAMDVPERQEDIWQHVRPRMIYLMAGQEDEHCYLIADCECDWEPEHGLAMVWRNGTTLCKVGGDDGHITNSYAYDDDTLADVVYVGIDRSFRTFLNP